MLKKKKRVKINRNLYSVVQKQAHFVTLLSSSKLFFSVVNFFTLVFIGNKHNEKTQRYIYCQNVFIMT